MNERIKAAREARQKETGLVAGCGGGLVTGRRSRISGECDRETLIAILEREGCDTLAGMVPYPRAPEPALEAACKAALAYSRSQKVYRAPPRIEGVARVIVQTGGKVEGRDVDSFPWDLVVAVEGNTGALVFRGVNGHPDDSPLSRAIEEEYRRARRYLTSGQVSAWLSSLCEDRWGGVGVLSPGSFYLPPRAVEEYYTTVAAVEMALPHFRMSDLPCATLADACETVMRDLEDEIRAAGTDLAAEIKAAAEGKGKGVRALEGSVSEKVAALRGKLARFADLFGRPARAHEDELAKIRANLEMTVAYRRSAAEGADVSAPVLLETWADAVIVPPTPEEALAELEADPAVRRFRLLETDGAVEPAPAPPKAPPKVAPPPAPSFWSAPVAVEEDDAAAARFRGLELD